MKSKKTMDEATREEVECLKFRGLSEDKARTLYEEYDERYRRAVETRRGDQAWFYIVREACGAYLREVYNVTEILKVEVCRL